MAFGINFSGSLGKFNTESPFKMNPAMARGMATGIAENANKKIKQDIGIGSLFFGDTMASGTTSQLSKLGSFNKNIDPSYFEGKSKEEVDTIFKSFEKRRQEILMQRSMPSISQILLTR